jgi:glutamate N-acetyltransferase/amino-acid N-acetyltransferase
VKTLEIRTVEGGVTAPSGFRAAGVACGIKASGGLDLALIASDRMASAAGVFTTNLAKAAPVVLSRQHLVSTRGQSRAVVINSGCANACTGADGWTHANVMADRVAAAVGCDPSAVLVASTGVIGVKLDIGKVERGVADAASNLSPAGGPAAARAIMTTDPFPKECAIEASANGRPFRVGGMAKGSGMIEPLMATMLGLITTDAAVEPLLLQRALKAVVDETFNAISVDGECSTNDCVFVLANGASGVELTEHDWPLLLEGLKAACEPLAVGIVRGGEGATKLARDRARDRRGNRSGRPAHRARDRQFTAREDGSARRRSELGEADRRRGPIGSSLFAGACGRQDWTGDALRGRHAARRARARGRFVLAGT